MRRVSGTGRPTVNIEPIDLQSLGAEVHIYGEIQDAAMRHFNPSIAWHNKKLKIAVRSCNFAVDRHGKWYFRDGSAYSKTDVLYGDLDPKTMLVSGLHKLELSQDSPDVTLIAGLEDVRLFTRKGEMYAIGFESDRVTRSLHNKSTSLAIYKVNNGQLKYIKTLEKPDQEAVEKNWCPPDEPSEIFDYTYSDTQVYKDGKLVGDTSQTDIHGGSILLRQEDGTYLSLVHDKVLDPTYARHRLNPGIYDKYIYRHYLARHGEDGIITHITKPFNFGTLENIEFGSGMVEYKNDLIISFGIRDCKYGIAKIPKKSLVDMLEQVSKIV